MQLLTHLHPPGGLRRRQSGDRDGQGARLLLRHLRGARHRPAHPHHRQQLHQVLHAAEALGGGRWRRLEEKVEELAHIATWGGEESSHSQGALSWK